MFGPPPPTPPGWRADLFCRCTPIPSPLTAAADSQFRVIYDIAEVSKKLRSSIRAVERAILADAPTLLGSGDATVVNQHLGLSRAYRYFRERAASPLLVEDVRQEFSYGEDGSGRGWSFVHGESVMRQNAFHDLVAAITAYLSLLEHDLVLSLSFQGFDPNNDSLLDVIGSRWKEKFTRVLGSDPVASRYRDRLTDVVERWRNPYSHGGFEKGHRATLYIQAPGVGTIPVGLSSIRDSPRLLAIPRGGNRDSRSVRTIR